MTFQNSALLRQKSKYFILGILWLGMGVIAYSQDYLPMLDALENEQIHVKIEGAYDQKAYKEVVDLNGVHYGKCLIMELKNKTSDSLFLELLNGTELVSEDTLVQNTVITKDIHLVLRPKERLKFHIYAMCAEFNDQVPRKGVTYEIGLKAPTRLYKVAQIISKHDAQQLAGQFAVWAVTDNIDKRTLFKYTSDSNVFYRAIALLDSAGVKTSLNKKDMQSLAKMMKQHQKNADNYTVYVKPSDSDDGDMDWLTLISTKNFWYGILISIGLLSFIYLLLSITGVVNIAKSFFFPTDLDDDFGVD